jgi:hypothetical protein
MLAAAAFVVLVVVGILLAGGGSNDSKPDLTKVAGAPIAGRRVVNGAIGAAISRPRGWTARSEGRAIELRSGDHATAVSISLPAGTKNANAVLSAAVDGVGRSYKKVQVARGGSRRLGGFPAPTAVVHATDPRGVRLGILLSAPQGRLKAWLVQVVTGPDRRGGRGLVEAQTALGTLDLKD